VLELKDKISSGSLSGSVAADAADFAAMPSGAVSSAVTEALEALMVLGYTQGEVAPILGKLDQSLSTQDMIKETLRIMNAKNMR
jgi:Holliday junction DNA helicase RuvA